MFRKIAGSFVLALFLATGSQAQSRTMSIGSVELRLGMPQEAVMTLLSGKYRVASMGASSFSVTQYDSKTKLYDVMGVIAFNSGQLSYINRDMDTSGWPDDEGYAISKAIYDAVTSSISRTDSDGAKRANATIVAWTSDVATPTRGTLRTINVYVNEQKVSILIWDGTDGKSVSASVAIQIKAW
jgi:hypothetical protein